MTGVQTCALPILRDFYRGYNIVNFPFGNTGAQMGGWFRKPFKSLAEFKGTKFRVGGFAGKVIERLGGVPQNLPAGEIYQALEKGTVDAAEWIGPYDDLKLGLYKVAKHYAYPAWWEGGPQLDLYVNTKVWDSLSSEHKAIIDAAATYTHIDIQAKYDYRNAFALKQLVAGGAQLFPLPKDMTDAAFKASEELYADLSAKNPNWKKVYADYSAWRREANIWFRVTEARFDSFMQSAKL